MKTLLYESEISVLECLWENGDMPAADLVPILEERAGWNKNTTYTILKRLIAKGYVERLEPKFICRPLITREEVERAHAEDLVERLHGGSNLSFLSAFVKNQGLSKSEINDLKALIDSLAEEK